MSGKKEIYASFTERLYVKFDVKITVVVTDALFETGPDFSILSPSPQYETFSATSASNEYFCSFPAHIKFLRFLLRRTSP